MSKRPNAIQTLVLTSLFTVASACYRPVESSPNQHKCLTEATQNGGAGERYSDSCVITLTDGAKILFKKLPNGGYQLLFMGDKHNVSGQMVNNGSIYPINPSDYPGVIKSFDASIFGNSQLVEFAENPDVQQFTVPQGCVLMYSEFINTSDPDHPFIDSSLVLLPLNNLNDAVIPSPNFSQPQIDQIQSSLNQ